MSNRRSNVAHGNFREAAYRGALLSYIHDEYQSIISYVRYCIKIFLTCFFILLFGALFKYIWYFKRH